MELRVADRAAVIDSRIRVVPVCASFWEGTERRPIEDLTGWEEALKDAVRNKHTVWIEARLDGLDYRDERWFDGSLEAWEPFARIPTVCWEEMDSTLRAVGLEPPEPTPTENEGVEARLLRVIPYLYVQGAFATIRDVCSNAGSAKGVKGLAAFPLLGFNPADPDSERSSVGYTMVRTMVGVMRKRIVVTIRLPDILFAESDDIIVRDSATSRLAVPGRFFPLLKAPEARDVAQAIGIHQAATAHAVARQIRYRLDRYGKLAEQLNDRREGGRYSRRRQGSTIRKRHPRELGDWKEDRRRGPADRRGGRGTPPDGPAERRKGPSERRRSNADLREEVIRANEGIRRLSEIAHGLDQQIARTSRRFGGVDAPRSVRELVPRDVRRGYSDALDEARSLQEECRLTAGSVTYALEAYDRGNRERFQLVTVGLSSFALISTVLAGLLAVSASEKAPGFLVFPTMMPAYILLASRILRTAHDQDWILSRGQVHGFAVVGLLIGLVVLGAYVLLF